MYVFRSSCPVRRGSTLVALTFATLAIAGLARAQALDNAIDRGVRAPAHIAVVEGAVSLDRESDGIPADTGEPLVPGDRLRTDAGRAEIWFSDGSTLALDAHGPVELSADSLVQLTNGRAYLMVSRTGVDERGDAVVYRVDTPYGSIAIAGPGEYVISLSADQIDLAVVRGSAELLADNGSVVVRSGERTVARANGSPASPQRFNAAHAGGFERWVASIHDARRGGGRSTQYLPRNLQMYGGTFDRDGSWSYEPSYGYVWYPTVDAGWRPYYYGVWRPLPRHGWTWVSIDRWGWPTHHYGRWGYGRSRWFWIPERRWAPAWVSWASAADYVSWCPLGFDNRPVVGFSLSVGNTWAGWVVLPRRSFGVRNAYVSRYAYDARRLPRNTPFALHARAPIAPPVFRGRYDARIDNPDSRRSASHDGWRTPLPPMAIPRGSGRTERSDRRDRADRTTRSDGAPGERANWDGRGDRQPVDDSVNVARRRGSPRSYPTTPSADNRPTPSAPRSGIRVDPGVPRAGD